MSLSDYDPHPGQLRAHMAVKNHQHTLVICGRQWGKSIFGAAEAALHALYDCPGESGLIVAPTYKHALTCRDYFNHMLPYKLRDWNGAESRWQIANGSVVFLRSVTDPDSTRGLTLSWAWLDESAMYSVEAWDTMRPAFAVNEADVWHTTTARGLNWVHRDFKQRPMPNSTIIEGPSTDSPYFPQDEADRLAAQYGIDSPWYRQEILAKFEAFVGQAFPMFDRTKHVASIVSTRQLPFIGGWDFGWTAPTVFVWAQELAGEKIVLHGVKTWTETARSLVLVETSAIPTEWDGIDPSGAVGARDVGDPGWRDDMEAKGRDPIWTRRVSESRRLNIMRQMLNEGRLVIAESAEGRELLVAAFELAELDKNPEKDRLADVHPHTDIVDAVGYMIANHPVIGARSAPTFSRH